MNYVGYEKNLNQSYLVIEPKEKEMLDHYQLRMLSENQLNGLLPCNIREIDGHPRAYYEITSCEELKKRYESKEITFEECRDILLSIQKTLYQMQEYLLDGNRLCLNENFMFWDNSNNQLKLLFLPKDDLALKDSFKKLAEYMLEKVDHRDDLAVSVAYHFYKDSRSDHFSLQSVIRVLNEAELKRAEQLKEQTKNDNRFRISQEEMEAGITKMNEEYERDMGETRTGEKNHSVVVPMKAVRDTNQENRQIAAKKVDRQIDQKKKHKQNIIKKESTQEENRKEKSQERKQFLKKNCMSIISMVLGVILGMVSLICPLQDTAKKGCLFGAVVLIVYGIYKIYANKKSEEDEIETMEEPMTPNLNQNMNRGGAQQPVLFPKNPYQMYQDSDMDFDSEMTSGLWDPSKAAM